MKTSFLLNATVLSSTLLLSAFPTVTRADWFFEVGPFYRGDVKISADGGSRAAGEGANAADPGVRGGTSVPAELLLNDDGSAAVLRTFDNGYVGPSGWAWAQSAGITQFFGYETSGQYDAGADTLSFTKTLTGIGGTAARTTTRLRNTGPGGWGDSERTHGAGLIATLGYRFGENDDPEAPEAEEDNDHAWSLLFRVGWLDGMEAGFRNRSAFGQDVIRRTVTTSTSGTATYRYTYDTLGNPFFPTAPYAMSDPAGVGPLIADTPETIALLSRSDARGMTGSRTFTSRAVSSVDLDVDVEAVTFQAGPRWSWNPDQAVSLFLQPAVTLNHIDVSARRNETFRDAKGGKIASWHDRADDQSWLWGAGVQLGAQFALSENWRLNGSGGYEWVHTTDVTVGPDRIHVDISGYQFEVALGRRF